MTPADQLRHLITAHGLTQREVAERLTGQGQPTAIRTVQAWLSDSDSRRNCPGWAVALLRLSLES